MILSSTGWAWMQGVLGSYENYAWWQKSGIHQLRLVVYPVIYKVFLHPRWCRISSINNFLDPETVSNQKLFVIVKSHIQQFFAIIWVHTTLFVQNRRIACSAIEIGHRDTVASFYWETIFQILRMKCHDPFSWLGSIKVFLGGDHFNISIGILRQNIIWTEVKSKTNKKHKDSMKKPCQFDYTMHGWGSRTNTIVSI